MIREHVLDLVNNGSIFTVIFEKSNGELRTITGRINVKKHLKGGRKTFSDEEKNLITIYSFKDKGYRSFKAGKIKELRARKMVFKA